jgi:hypothetical protein
VGTPGDLVTFRFFAANEEREMTQDTDKGSQTPNMDGNQGEGNRGAAEAYNKGAQQFAKGGRVEEQAQKARRDLEGAQGDELRRAEEEGKSHAKGEDPALRKD